MAETIKSEKKSWIPSISDERLQELFEQIKPVVHFDESGLRYIKPVDLRRVAYTWNPEPAEKATELVALCDITTYHAYGFYGFFKPSIAEVLAQIPGDCLSKVVAFEVMHRPRTLEDINIEHDAIDAGYHVATTRLYAQK